MLQASRGKYAIVLMDMQMPEMDGLTATREIRKMQVDGERTPIVALTANVMGEEFQRCIDAGMDDALGKPIDAARLQDVLERYLPLMASTASLP
jgi:CheY-like chemotaxis protein